MAMKIHQKEILLALTILLSCTVGQAVAEENVPLFNFKFTHLSNVQSTDSVFQPAPSTNNNALEFAQYDATWTYPWESKNVNVGLGLTLRHLSGYKYSAESSGNNYFQEVLPLFHASALFALPLEGLYAGLEGSHLDSLEHQVFDYRAKVTYEWREGFGLQGGWQHQQFNLDSSTNTGAGYQQTGPFIDFYLNF
jgi:hypothetical protein